MKGLKLIRLLHPNHHRSEKHVVLVVIHGLKEQGNYRGYSTSEAKDVPFVTAYRLTIFG